MGCSAIGPNADGLRHLDAGAFAQPATDAFVSDVGLFQHADLNSDILKRAGTVTDAAGLALIGQAQLFIDHGVPHLDFCHDLIGFALNFRDCAGRADFTAFHT